MSANSGSVQRKSEGKYVDLRRITLLESLRTEDQVWAVIAARYGVTNPDPPWKTPLHATCECLSDRGALDSLERRHAEDELGEAVYTGVPNPERQLLALVHTMLSRGLIAEGDLASRMRIVRSRLAAV